jgi:predicted acyl esterase
MLAELSAATTRRRRGEARDDVLIFTTDPVDTDLVCVGQVKATLAITSTNAYSDLFVRICDVTPDGRSLNVIHGFVRRVEAAGERTDVHIDLGPIGHRFARGHRRGSRQFTLALDTR